MTGKLLIKKPVSPLYSGFYMFDKSDAHLVSECETANSYIGQTQMHHFLVPERQREFGEMNEFGKFCQNL